MTLLSPIEPRKPALGELQDIMLGVLHRLRGFPSSDVREFIDNLFDHMCCVCGYVDLPKYGKCPDCGHRESQRAGILQVDR